MASKTRVANKTIWAFEDITALVGDARLAWEKAQAKARRQMDPVLVLALADISNALAKIETLAREGRQGKYHGR